jgi:hypothetical protein
MDRFGDDLCQLLLSYLQLYDCFRCECVSKQWQRLIYTTVYELTIDRELIHKMRGKRNFCDEDFIDISVIAAIIRKCPNIESIEFPDVVSYKLLARQVFETIADLRDNCLKRLSRIGCDLYFESQEVGDYYFHTFGDVITGLDLHRNKCHFKTQLCPKLKNLIVKSMAQVFTEKDNQLAAKNLR